MLFNSVDFFYFLPVVICLYYILPHRFRWLWLLVSSYFFYMCWEPVYLVLIIISTSIDFIAGISIEDKPKYKRLFLGLSILGNLGVLVYFKYFNFINKTLSSMFNQLSLVYKIENHHWLPACRYFILYFSNPKLYNRCIPWRY